MSIIFNFLHSIIIIFLFFFKIFKASFLYPLDTTISKKVLFNSKANFLETIEFIATTPPNALTGSHLRALLKESIS